MKSKQIVKAHCARTNRYFALEAKKVDGAWRVVNMDDISPEDARLLVTWISEDPLETHTTLLPCQKCGSRRVGACTCAQKAHPCSSSMGYHFDCTYCKECVIDYSIPKYSFTDAVQAGVITVQGTEFKVVTFGNVEWREFDKLVSHVDGRSRGYAEPTDHVVPSGTDIEFHGYNISAMDEGVYYDIGEQDNFIIECDVDTSTIQPHPGGQLYISLGIITANITQNGGSFLLDGTEVAKVGSRFHMRLSLTEGGKYDIIVNNARAGSKFVPVSGTTRITFGFSHTSHDCHILSHAYLRDIRMLLGGN